MIANYWSMVLESLRSKVGVGEYRTWVSTLKFLQVESFGKKIVLEVKSSYHKNYIDRKLKTQVLNSLKKYYPTVSSIEYQISEGGYKPKTSTKNTEFKKDYGGEILVQSGVSIDLVLDITKSNNEKIDFETKRNLDRDQNKFLADKKAYSENEKKIKEERVEEIEAKKRKVKENNTAALNFETLDNISKPETKYSFLPSSNISGVNPKLSFENFVIGSFNELAGSVAKSITKKLGSLYNPVFIHSDVGLGKTHLLHAIGNLALEYNPSVKIRYTTCEKFFGHYIQALNNKNMDAFREYYRNIDLLLVDDIQFLAGKESTQEIFFHTFNELHSQGKQIVITSDISPQELSLKSVAARLVSRFQWGIVVDIIRPNLEDRQALIESKLENLAQTQQIPNITKEQVLKMATNLEGSVRDIEGGINRLIAQINIQKTKILKTAENDKNTNGESSSKIPTKSQKGDKLNIDNLEKNIIIESLAGSQSKQIEQKIQSQIDSNIEAIINKSNKTNKKGRSQALEIVGTVIGYYGLSEAAIMSKIRSKQVSSARQIIMYLLKVKLNWSYLDIAKFFDRDHTTIMHGFQKIESSIRHNPDILKEIGF